eukprot:1646153-Rhodomonas_salina.1
MRDVTLTAASAARSRSGCATRRSRHTSLHAPHPLACYLSRPVGITKVPPRFYVPLRYPARTPRALSLGTPAPKWLGTREPPRAPPMLAPPPPSTPCAPCAPTPRVSTTAIPRGSTASLVHPYRVSVPCVSYRCTASQYHHTAGQDRDTALSVPPYCSVSAVRRVYHHTAYQYHALRTTIPRVSYSHTVRQVSTVCRVASTPAHLLRRLVQYPIHLLLRRLKPPPFASASLA